MTKKIIFFTCFITILLLANSASFVSYYYNTKWEKYLIQENFEKAIESFLKANNKESTYNIWNAYYKSKKYNEAISYYLLVQNSSNEDLVASAYNNIWNSYYRVWKQNEEKKLENYLNAVLYYNKSLEIKYDEEVEKNRDFVLEKIKELENQKQEEKKSNEENSDNQEWNNNEEENVDEKSNEENTTNQNVEDWNTENGNQTTEKNENNQLTEEEISQIEQYQEILKKYEEWYSDTLNKVYEENDSLFNDFGFFPFFDDSLLNPNNKKDW